MLYFGNTYMAMDDLNALRQSVKLLHNRLQRPLKGVEIGPWLGRSTLSILAPDLPIGNPNPFASLACDMMTLTYGSDRELAAVLDQKMQYFANGYSVDKLKELLFCELSYLINPKKKYFSKLWCVDTWGGIGSERDAFFRESFGSAQQIFDSNVEKAGFSDVVTPIKGTSSRLSDIHDEVDFVFIDADHEYDSVAKDLFAVRRLLTPGSLLCGHDFGSDRWPGVELAVRDYVRSYITISNVWIATKEGIDHLLSLPAYEAFAGRIERRQKDLDKRYTDPAYCARHQLVMQ